jgi:hypothetical protein
MLRYLALLGRRRLEVLHLLVPLSQLRLQPRHLPLLLFLLKKPVLRIRIHMFLGLPVRGMDPNPDRSIIRQKFLSLENYVNILSKSTGKNQKNNFLKLFFCWRLEGQ